MDTERGVIIVYEDKDQDFAHKLYYYLKGTEGRILSLRSGKYGCDARYYRKVIRIDQARINDPQSPNLLDIKPIPYKEAKRKSTLPEYSYKTHIEVEARRLANNLRAKI